MRACAIYIGKFAILLIHYDAGESCHLGDWLLRFKLTDPGTSEV